MSGELARAVRERTELDLMAERAGLKLPPIGAYWAVWAIPTKAIANHVDFVYLNDERVPIPQRGKDG